METPSGCSHVRETLLAMTALAAIALGCSAASAQDRATAQGAQAGKRAAAQGAVLPFPPTPSASIAAPRLQDSKHVRRTEPNRLPAGRAEHPHRAARRCRLRPADHLRRRDRDADPDAARQEGISYNHSTRRRSARRRAPRCSPAATTSASARARSPSGRSTGTAIPASFRRPASTVAEVLRQYGYKTAAFGKWHNTPATEDDGDGAVRSLADRLRLRLFLRLPGRRDIAVRAAAVREHDGGRAAARSEVSPDRGHGRQGAGLAQAPSLLRSRQAVPDVLGARRRAWPAPRLQGMGRQVQGQVRRRLGRLPRARLRAPEAAGLDPAGHEADAARRDDGVMGQHPGGRAAVPATADGSVRRLRRAHRHASRPAGRRPGASLACATTRSSSTSSATTVRAPRDRTAASASCWRRTRSPTRSSSSSTRWTRSADSTRSARPRPTTCITPAGPGPAARRSITPSWSRRISAARAIRWSSPGRRASSPTRRRARSSTTSTISRRRSTTFSASSRREVVDGFKQDPIDGVSMAYTFADATAPGRKTTQYFDNNGSRGIYHDGWYASTFGPLTPWLTVSPGLEPGIRARTSGSSTTCGTTSRRRTISPQSSPNASPR